MQPFGARLSRLTRSLSQTSAFVVCCLLATSTLVFIVRDGGYNKPIIALRWTSEEDTQVRRGDLLHSKCRQYLTSTNPPRSLLDEPRTLGTEVVYLLGPKTVPTSVCIPHKVGSHAWGKFATLFNGGPGGEELRDDFLKLDFKTRSAKSVRVVVVRHPLERLVSVYRMIFENWCDQDRWLAKQWKSRVCQDPELFDTDFVVNDDFKGFIQINNNNRTSSRGDKSDLGPLLRGMFSEYKFGNDRYMVKIWRKFHPEAKRVSREQLKFTFAEFARFLVNGSTEFSGDPYVIGHQGLSYHWNAFHKECSLCSTITAPNFIIHLGTLESDVKELMQRIGADPGALPFPHTHAADGASHSGPSASEELLKRYYSTLTRDQVQQLYKLYQIDHDLFGFTPDKFIDYALL